jgi:hypothetical protein
VCDLVDARHAAEGPGAGRLRWRRRGRLRRPCGERTIRARTARGRDAGAGFRGGASDRRRDPDARGPATAPSARLTQASSRHARGVLNLRPSVPPPISTGRCSADGSRSTTMGPSSSNSMSRVAMGVTTPDANMLVPARPCEHSLFPPAGQHPAGHEGAKSISDVCFFKRRFLTTSGGACAVFAETPVNLACASDPPKGRSHGSSAMRTPPRKGQGAGAPQRITTNYQSARLRPAPDGSAWRSASC